MQNLHSREYGTQPARRILQVFFFFYSSQFFRKACGQVYFQGGILSLPFPSPSCLVCACVCECSARVCSRVKTKTRRCCGCSGRGRCTSSFLNCCFSLFPKNLHQILVPHCHVSSPSPQWRGREGSFSLLSRLSPGNHGLYPLYYDICRSPP